MYQVVLILKLTAITRNLAGHSFYCVPVQHSFLLMKLLVSFKKTNSKVLKKRSALLNANTSKGQPFVLLRGMFGICFY
jgi:hypothetical protein